MPFYIFYILYFYLVKYRNDTTGHQIMLHKKSVIAIEATVLVRYSCRTLVFFSSATISRKFKIDPGILNNMNTTPAMSDCTFEYAAVKSTSELFNVHQQKSPLDDELNSTCHALFVKPLFKPCLRLIESSSSGKFTLDLKILKLKSIIRQMEKDCSTKLNFIHK